METNLVNVLTAANREWRTRALYQYDYGMKLIFDDVDLPQYYEMHFSHKRDDGEAMIVIGDSTGCAIPDTLLADGKPIHAWIFLHTGVNDGETVVHITIPVKERPEPKDIEITPAESSTISQTIQAINDALDRVIVSENRINGTISQAIEDLGVIENRIEAIVDDAIAAAVQEVKDAEADNFAHVVSILNDEIAALDQKTASVESRIAEAVREVKAAEFELISQAVDAASESANRAEAAADHADDVIDSLEHTVDTHVANDYVHVTTEDRQLWDGKVSCAIDQEDQEMLSFY